MKIRGFTLLEVLLVLVIIASVMIMFVGYTTRKAEETRMDKMVITAQQILSANLAYYNNHGSWTPCTASGNCYLQTGDGLPLLEEGYLPNQNYTTLWPSGTNDYIQFSPPTDKKFTICIPIVPSSAARGIAETVAARLPLGFATQSTDPCGENIPIVPCTDETQTCRVVSMVNVPGQNLNNARSLNFGGVYHNGACVPVPECPDGMTPQIFVTPTSVSGLWNGMNGSNGTSGDVFPISSFTASAKGPAMWDRGTGESVESCTPPPGGGVTPCFQSNNASTGDVDLPSGKYWRVCLDIVTEKGKVVYPKYAPEAGSVMAITRCVPQNEPSGSEWNVFNPF